MRDRTESTRNDVGFLLFFAFLGAWVLVVAALALDVWILLIPVAPLLLVGGLGAFVLFFTVPREDLKRVQVERAGYTKDHFFLHFAQAGLRREAIEQSYQALQVWLPSPDFPVTPTDRLDYRFGMVVHEEIDDILKECLCREPTDDKWEGVYAVRTVEDLVLIVDHLYTGEPQNWQSWYQLPWSWRNRIIVAIFLLPIIGMAIVALISLANWLH